VKAKGDPRAFLVQQLVRYKPGMGTYGYEEVLERDGRIPAIVVGHTATRVRIELLVERGHLRRKRVTIDAASLQAAL
jgi:hypothetical protein